MADLSDLMEVGLEVLSNLPAKKKKKEDKIDDKRREV